MRRFVRFVIVGWGSVSNLDEPTPAPTILARWRQWRGRGEWPGSFARTMRDGLNTGWEDGQREIARIYAKHGVPYTPEPSPWRAKPQ